MIIGNDKQEFIDFCTEDGKYELTQEQANTWIFIKEKIGEAYNEGYNDGYSDCRELHI